MVQLPKYFPKLYRHIVQTLEGGRFASELSFTLNHIETSTTPLHAPIEDPPFQMGASG